VLNKFYKENIYFFFQKQEDTICIGLQG